MTGNGATKWIAIIISILIATVSLSVGVIRTSNKDRIDELSNHVMRHDEEIRDAREAEIRLDMRLLNIEKQTSNIDKKIDILIKRTK